MTSSPNNNTHTLRARAPRLGILAAGVALAACIGLSAGARTPVTEDNELGELPALPGAPSDVEALMLFTPDFTDGADAHIQLCDSLVQQAVEAYRTVAELRVNPNAKKADLYQAAENAVNLCNVALTEVDFDSRHGIQMRETMRDLNPTILDAAFHYSGLNDQNSVTRMARMYIDMQIHPVMKGRTFPRDPRTFPTVAYIAASGAYNAKEWPKAVVYFREFFKCPDENMRQKVTLYMAHACLNAGDYDLAVETAEDGLQRFPSDPTIARIGAQACIAGGRAEKLEPFLDTALSLDPDNEAMLTNKGKLLEDRGRWGDALQIYQRLKAMKPTSLTIAQHEALCYYNIAVNFFNRAVNESDQKQAQRQRHQARDYFDAALMLLDDVVASSPMDAKYLRAAAVCALCLENTSKFEKLNSRLAALGEDPLSDVFMPGVITTNDANAPNFASAGLAPSTAQTPSYSEYASSYVTDELRKFVTKDEFETLEKYRLRVTDRSIAAETQRLKQKAADTYLATYGKSLSLSDLHLHPYDADNQTFLVETTYGYLTLPVPNKGDEARSFKENWSSVQLREAKWFIDSDSVRVRSVKFVLPSGRSYTYDNARALDYKIPDINIDVASIVEAAQPKQAGSAGSGIQRERVDVGLLSDVDRDIPVSRKSQPSTYALVIANENYGNGIAKVESALHDGRIMAEYIEKTLGVPRENIQLLSDASLANMIAGVARLEQLVNASTEPADVIVYYAGHGMPDEATKDAYLLPVDGSPTLSSVNLSLGHFTDRLANLNAASVVTFIDACFTGTSRSDNVLVYGRTVSIKPKVASPKGNAMVLSATTDQQTALPYREKNHGMFTYWLLKKLQETQGNTTLKELADYVTDRVRRTSLQVNGKDQVPSVSLSGSLSTEWTKKKLRK